MNRLKVPWLSALAVGLMASLVTAQSIDTTLLAKWSFEKNGEFHTYDQSGNHHDIMVFDGFPNIRILPGPYGWHFDNIGDDYKTVVRESAGKFNNPVFTVAAFVQRLTPAKTQTIFQNTAVVNGAIAGYRVQLGSNGTIQAVFGDSASSAWTTISSPAVVPLGQIRHVAVTYDGSTVQFYSNGVSAGSSSYTNSFYRGAGSAIVGATVINGGYQNIYKDKVDEIAVYKRALSGSEIHALANPPKPDVTGCWDIEQDGPGQLYTGTMSLTQASNNTITGTITWNSIYGSTTVTGTIFGSNVQLVAHFTSPTVLTLTYTGTISSDTLRIESGNADDSNGGRFPWSGVKRSCSAPPQDTASICWTTRQEKNPGSGTWWIGNMALRVLDDGTIVGGTIDWDVPSHGTVTGGRITADSAIVITYNETFSMNVTYRGALTSGGTSISGTSNGTDAFNATMVDCETPPVITTQCWTTRQEKAGQPGQYWLGYMNIEVAADGTITGGTIDWDVPSHGTITGGSITGTSATILSHNETFNIDVTYSGTVAAGGSSITSGQSNPGGYYFDALKVACP